MIIVAFSSNLRGICGSSVRMFERAIEMMPSYGIYVSCVASVYKSFPEGPVHNQPPFLNTVARVFCTCGPVRLLERLHRIEARLGRVRKVLQGPRVIDLDLIDYHGWVGCFEGVVLPHPRAKKRVFVLAPLREIAPEWRDPCTGETVQSLLRVARLDVARLDVARLDAGQKAYCTRYCHRLKIS